MVERYRARPHPPRYRGPRQPMRMDDYLKRWINIHASRNHWRVAHWLDLDDLIQDGYLLWRQVTLRYLETVNQRAHMVAMFQTTFIRHIHALANRRTKSVGEVQIDVIKPVLALEEADDLEPACLSDDGDGARAIELRGLLAKAPEPLRKLLAFFEHGDLRPLLHPTRKPHGYRETPMHRLARLTGQVAPDGSVPDFRKLLKDCLES